VNHFCPIRQQRFTASKQIGNSCLTQCRLCILRTIGLENISNTVEKEGKFLYSTRVPLLYSRLLIKLHDPVQLLKVFFRKDFRGVLEYGYQTDTGAEDKVEANHRTGKRPFLLVDTSPAVLGGENTGKCDKHPGDPKTYFAKFCMCCNSPRGKILSKFLYAHPDTFASTRYGRLIEYYHEIKSSAANPRATNHPGNHFQLSLPRVRMAQPDSSVLKKQILHLRYVSCQRDLEE